MRKGAALVLVLAAVLGAAACGGDEGDAPDAAPPGPDADFVPPEQARLVINELMAANALTFPGGHDWVEIYNPDEKAVDLTGWALGADLAAAPTQPLMGSIDARGFVIVEPAFSLPREGGSLGLARPDGTWADRLTFGAQAVDLSAARTPDGSDEWSIVWQVTPGAANPGGGGAPSLSDEVEQVPAAGDVSERILGEDVFPAFELQVPDESAASLRIQPLVYVPATLVYEGRSYGPVAIRLKGNNSFRPFDEKPSIKIKVDAYTPGAELFGLEDLTLNNMHNDPSMMHERLAYRVARQAGVPASRCNHATLTVNGMPYGLYAHVEAVRPRMIGRWFSDRTGSLFEMIEVDFTEAQIPGFELESGADDRTALYGVAASLALAPDAAMSGAAAWLDLPAFRRFWATAAVIAQYDAFPYGVIDPLTGARETDDAHVYLDPTGGKLHFIPWGMDETMRRWWRDPADAVSLLAIACRDSAACRADWVDEIWAVQSMTEEMDLAGRAEEVMEQIAAATVADTRKAYSDADVAAAQDELLSFIATRREKLLQQFP
jgi:spore coat protein CotH